MNVFISKKVNHRGLLELLEQRKATLLDEPMISFSPVDFNCPANKSYAIAFFSSPRSVHFFLEKCQLYKGVEIGCIGKKTEQELRKNGLASDFTGDKSGDPSAIAEAFKRFVSSKKVLFPQSDRSNKSMQQELDEDQIIDLIVYKTALTPVMLPIKPRVLVFTSPSNTEAFLQAHQIHEQQHIIAWGGTTENYLISKGVNVDHTLSHSSFDELTSYLKDLL